MPPQITMHGIGSQATSNTISPSDRMDYEMESSSSGVDMGYEHAPQRVGTGYVPYDATVVLMNDTAPAPQPDYGYGDTQHPGRPDYGYEETHPINRSSNAEYGYEEAPPSTRRASMSKEEEKERRASIKAIMADNTISPLTKRRSIQHLMDGRRNSMHSVTSQGSRSSDLSYNDMGYGDQTVDAPTTEFCVEIQPRCNEQTKRDERSRPPCNHYERNCTMIAPCCGAPFGCRICHDDCPVLPPKIDAVQRARRVNRSASLPSSFTFMGPETPEDTNHQIDRFAVKEVICRKCYTRQSSKTNNCVGCGVQFGEYHCSVCNLWMSSQERPYHCDKCGFCRVGGAENFKHCDACGMCIDRSLYDSHNCNEGKYKSNCPVCQEFMFSSRSASHEMPCGHAIHWDCFQQLAAHDSRCPVCKKTAETRERMLPTWNAMAQNIAMQPVPAELARVVNVACNDCENTCDAQAWHFLGVQCIHCQSFNTVVTQIVLTGEEAHEFLEMNAIRQAIYEARATGDYSSTRRRVNRRRSAI